jgi:hypothetical protein
LPASLLSLEQLRSVIESLLFVAGRPLDFGELRRLFWSRSGVYAGDPLAGGGRSAGPVCAAALGNTAQSSRRRGRRFVAALLGCHTGR